MPEACPLSRSEELQSRVMGAAELSQFPECVDCLARTATRLGIRRPRSELGIELDGNTRRLMQMGLAGGYYGTPGKSLSSRLNCQAGAPLSGLAKAEFGSPVIERRKLQVRDQNQLLEQWKNEFGSDKGPTKIGIPSKLLEYPGNTFLVEELVARLSKDLIEDIAEDDLSQAAIVITKMERIFTVLIGNSSEVRIMADIWAEIQRDPQSKVSAIVKQIHTRRQTLPRKKKKFYPSKPKPSNVFDLDKARREKEHRNKKH